MSIDFTKLKKKTSVKSFADAVAEKTKKADYKDSRYWKLTIEKQTGDGSADIRFLPAPMADGDEAPDFVLMRSHAFQGPTGKWYIEKSPVTIGQPCPVYQYAKKLWDAGGEANQVRARALKLQKKYIANILVLKDPANPENDGKVFLFEFGPQIFSILEEISKETDPDEQINPFSPWEGATFKLKSAKTKGANSPPSYERSKFGPRSVLLGGDEAKLTKVLEAEYSLAAEIAPSKFKSFDDLKTKMETVLQLSAVAQAAKAAPKRTAVEDDSDEEEASTGGNAAREDVDSDDDDLAAFRELADE